MKCQPLPGRHVVTRENQVKSDWIVIPDTYSDPRNTRNCDMGTLLAVGKAPKGAEQLEPGQRVFYIGPGPKLEIDWFGQKAFVVHFDEILAVVDP